MRRGDIYLVDLTNHVGSEQAGVRPAVIVQNEVENIHSPTTIICPLTSKDKTPVGTHVAITTEDGGVVRDSTILCEQVRVIDKSRLVKRLGEISNRNKIMELNEKLMISLGVCI